MKPIKFIATTISEYLNEQLKYKLDGNYVNYFINGDKIGYIEYYYDGGQFSEHLPNLEKEFYIAMISVDEKFRGNDYSTLMINHIKIFAKEKGATIITLRVDDGLGFSKRQSNKGLERLYLKNGFKHQHTENDFKINQDLNLGAMYYEIK